MEVADDDLAGLDAALAAADALPDDLAGLDAALAAADRAASAHRAALAAFHDGALADSLGAAVREAQAQQRALQQTAQQRRERHAELSACVAAGAEAAAQCRASGAALATVNAQTAYLKLARDVERATERARGDPSADNVLAAAGVVEALPASAAALRGVGVARVEALLQTTRAALSKEVKELLPRLPWPLLEGSELDAPAAVLQSVRALARQLAALQAAGARLGAASADPVTQNWAVHPLAVPLVQRFRFHFEGPRPTNRLDKPEWCLSHVVQTMQRHAPFLEDELQPELDEAGLGGYGAQTHLLRALVGAVRRKLRRSMDQLAELPSQLMHTIDELLVFEKTLQGEFDQGQWDDPDWPLAVDEFARDDSRLARWVQIELDVALERYEASMREAPWSAPSAPHSDLRPSASAEALVALLHAVTERFQLLRAPAHHALFVHRIHKVIALQYLAAARNAARSCAVGRGSSAPLAADAWALFAAVGNSCEYVAATLLEWESEPLFVALQATQAATDLRRVFADIGGKVAASAATVQDAIAGSAAVAAGSSAVAAGSSAVLEAVEAMQDPGTLIGPGAVLSLAAQSRFGQMAGSVAAKVWSSSSAAVGQAVSRVVSADVSQDDDGAPDDGAQDDVAQDVDACMDGAPTVFAHERNQFSDTVDHIVGDACDALLACFAQRARPYAARRRLREEAQLVPDMSPELRDALATLREQLQTLRAHLSPGIWRRVWPRAAQMLSGYLWDSVLPRKKFTAAGVQQLEHDLSAVYAVFRPFCARPENLFKPLKEALIVLQGPSSPSSLSSLEDMGVFRLTEEEAERVRGQLV